MSFVLNQMLDRAPQVPNGTTTADGHQQNKLENDLIKLARGLNRHIQATGCIHCKHVVKEYLGSD